MIRRGGFAIVAVVAATAFLIAATGVLAAAADAERGRALYERTCFACHSMESNRVGPQHNGVFGRRAGRVPGYAYSPALARSRIVWDEQTLDRWLTDPETLIPGQRMGYRVTEPSDRADIIAYLKIASHSL
jgi:cytochrome c